MKDALGHGSNSRSGGAVRLDSANSPAKKTGYKGSSKQETIAMRKAIDETHYPTTSINDRLAAATLGQGHPKSVAVPLGSSFLAAGFDLIRGRNVAVPRGAENRRKS